MNNGWLKGEFLAAGMEQAAAAGRALADSERHLQDVRQLASKIEQHENAIAANLAEKYALREALRKLNPKHPLLTNASLRERIHAAGERALAVTQNFDAARDAGISFKID